MLARAMATLSALTMPLFVQAASIFSSKPDDPTAVVLTKEAFPELHADGIGDDTAVLQRAIDRAGASGLLLLIPEGRYRISQTLGVPPSTRLIGFGKTRPALVLAGHTPGYDAEPPKYMVWFAGRAGRSATRPSGAAGGGSVGGDFSDATPGTFYSGLSNIDFEIGDGNSAAVAIRAHFAQHGIIEHVDFHVGSGYAAMDQVGNFARDLHVFGGAYGIVSSGTSPSWQYTLVDSSFDGQRVAAFKTHNTGLTLVRDRFSNMPTAVAIDRDQCERLWMSDCRLDNLTGPALVIGDEDNVRTQINLRDVVCRKTPAIASYLQSGRRVPAPSGDVFRIEDFSYGLRVSDDDGRPPAIRESLTATPVDALPPPTPTDIPALPPVQSWANVRDFGATGDGKADDGPAFAVAVSKAKVVFLPAGRYRVTDSVRLKPDTVLVGLNPITTQVAIDDAAPRFTGPGELAGVIDAPPGGANVVQGIGIDTGANNPRAAGLAWRSGPASLVNDVKFLGGHGTFIPGGPRPSPYNRDHTGDPDLARKWDSSGPSLWVTDQGGGTLANVWTASTFASAGLLVEHTATPGRVYELSSEHHVRNEVIFRDVSNWNIYAQQTEEEWGESPACLPVSIDRCRNLTFANTILFRVFAMAAPFPTGISVGDSHDLRFFGIRTYGQSPFNFDRSLVDTSTGFAVPDREIAAVLLTGSGANAPAGHAPRPVKVADGFYSADHAVADSVGRAYFVDVHENKVYQFSPDTSKVTVLRDDPIKPFALAVDRGDNLIILSRLGKAFAVSPKDPRGPLTELSPVPAAPRPGLTAFLPADRWWDGGHFLETNARREPLDFVSPDGSTFVPVPSDYHTGQQHNWTGQPIDLYRGNQLAPATPGKPFLVADENEHKTWAFTPTDEGTLLRPRLFAQRGEAGVATDAAGNVYIAEGDIYVYDAAGKPVDRIPLPDRVLGLVFCGQDRRTLFITTRHAAYVLRMTGTGRP